MSEPVRELIGHTSPETAYLVQDYPYSFRLRCQIRYWIETRSGHGQRVMSQTCNPKTGRWNKPKASTYTLVRALFLDDQEHVQNAGLGGYNSEEEIAAFIARYPLTAAEERNQRAIEYLHARNRVNATIEWTISTPTPGETVQTPEEQAEILRKLTAIEYARMQAEKAEK